MASRVPSDMRAVEELLLAEDSRKSSCMSLRFANAAELAADHDLDDLSTASKCLQPDRAASVPMTVLVSPSENDWPSSSSTVWRAPSPSSAVSGDAVVRRVSHSASRSRVSLPPSLCSSSLLRTAPWSSFGTTPSSTPPSFNSSGLMSGPRPRPLPPSPPPDRERGTK